MSIQETEEQTLHISPATPGRIRSHSLKPQHSRLDYARRKSAADITTSPIVSSAGDNDDDDDDDDFEESSSTGPLSSWFKRRFTLFSIEQPINQKHRMTTDRFSFFDDKTCSDLLKQKRPSVIAQMVESFVRRISSRKKKRNNEREEDQPVIDPVYETLKIAAETRKRTIAHYLQQRQQSLNKQQSLNSQGSSEPDVQLSPKVIRRNDMNPSPQPTPISTPRPPSTPRPQTTSLSTSRPPPTPQLTPRSPTTPQPTPVSTPRPQSAPRLQQQASASASASSSSGKRPPLLRPSTFVETYQFSRKK